MSNVIRVVGTGVACVVIWFLPQMITALRIWRFGR